MAHNVPYRANWGGEGPLRKFVVPQRKVDEERREITFKISTPARDRDGDVIMVDGWDLDSFMKNPVVLWAHDAGAPPIAKARSIRVQGNALVSTAQFAERDAYAFADTVFQLYKGGFLSAVSVGFMPTELELMEGPEPGDFGFRFLKQELMEYSAVPIPSNPEALVVARGQGVNVDPLKRWITHALDEKAAGGFSELLNKAYIALHGKLHPVMQQEIADKNAAAIRGKQPDPTDPPVEDDDEEEPEAAVVETSPPDNPDAADPHTHELEVGDTETQPGEDDGHIHAVNYDEDTGEPVIEEAEGHSHDAPPAATVDVEDEDEDEDDDDEPPAPAQSQQNESARGVTLTDWPQPGLNFKVALVTSEYRPFPIAEAKALQEDWPELWDLGEGDLFDAIVEGKENAIRAREKWAARNVDGWDIKATVSQVRHLVRGSRGIEHMRQVLSMAKEEALEKRGQVSEANEPDLVDQDALIKHILERGVYPAVEAAIRRHSGRVS